MLYSMTGYGRREVQMDADTLIIEVRTLNGRQLDINSKISTALRPYEHHIRNIIKQYLHRGSVDCSVFYNQNGSVKPMKLNVDLAKLYYESVHRLSKELNENTDNILSTILNLPEVISQDNVVVDDTIFEQINQLLIEVLEDVVSFREKEGAAIYEDLKNRAINIQNYLADIKSPEAERITKIKDRINKALSELIQNNKLDENRLEQEMIYYIEKIDISEEKARLTQHCKLFLEMIAQDNTSGIGKKLNFILQEMGREINTIGSKANDARIQSIVVNMKDELEKAKEQSLNVL